MPERSRFGLEVAPEVREELLGRAEHGVERHLVDPVGVEHGCQRGIPSSAGVHLQYFALDAVHAGGEGQGSLFPDRDLGLKCPAAEITIGTVGQVANGAHWKRPHLTVDLDGYL